MLREEVVAAAAVLAVTVEDRGAVRVDPAGRAAVPATVRQAAIRIARNGPIGLTLSSG